MNWTPLPTENWSLYSAIGIRLVDEFTSLMPKYAVDANLEFRDPTGNWQPVRREAVWTPSGIVSYPELGRSAHAATQPVVRHRVLLSSDFYRPEYLRNSDGIEFDVHPYDDSNPPAVVPTHPRTELLFPNPMYGYPSHVRVVKGIVHDAGGDPVANVEVTEGLNERVLTDERGAFALPLRWPAFNAAVSLDAVDHRTGRSDTININLPGDLDRGHLFTIT